MIRILIIGLLVATAAWQFSQAGLIHSKAWLGQLLLERAWQRTGSGTQPARPWPGAVSHPIARLQVSRLEIDYLVLDGADTPVLAWGPGMETGPGGHRLLAGHRDTHFRFLRHLEIGDALRLEHADGRFEHWQVSAIEVADSRTTALDMGLPADVLTLVTCYPFDAPTAGGPLRYVVSFHPGQSQTDKDPS